MSLHLQDAAEPTPAVVAAGSDTGYRLAQRLLRGPLRPLVGGQCLGQAADGLAQIAFAQLVVFDTGRGATPQRIAAVLAVTLLPFSLIGPFAGVVIDRWPRRQVLHVVSLVRALITLGATATVVVGSEVGAFVGVLLLLSSSRFALAAKGAALPSTVPKQDLVPANALSSVAGMTAGFLGAITGAGVVGWTPAAGFVAASLLYLAAASVFTRLPDVGGGGTHPTVRQVVADLEDGLRTIARTPAVRVPLTAVWVHRLLSGAGFVVLVLAADARFHLHIAGYALALLVTGAASFAGSLLAPVSARRWSPVALLPVAFLPPAVAAYAGGLAPSLVLLLVGLATTALFFQVLKVLVDALVGGGSPQAVRGRVFSVYDVLYNVAFVAAGLLMIPLWQPNRVRPLLWLLAAGFALGWLGFARLLQVWPFAATVPLPRPARRWRRRVVAVACGALPVLAFPAVAWWWLAWVALVPLLLVVRDAPTPREGAVRGWCGGAGFVAATMGWLLPVTGPGLVLMGAALGVLWLPWGWAAQQLLSGVPDRARAVGALLVLPAGWVAIEAVRSWQSLGGPWALLGASQWNAPSMLASAALGGVWLTGFLVVLVNVTVVLVLVGSSLRVLAAGTAVLALLVGPAWAGLRPVPHAGRDVRVAVVQPGVVHAAGPRFDRQVALTAAVADRHPDLVVWSESSVSFDLPSNPRQTAQLLALSRNIGADLLVNVDARRGGRGIYKSTVLVTPDGLGPHYDKTRLVPFGEYIPLRNALSWLTLVSRAASENRHRGHGPVVMHDRSVVLGALICFESAFPDMSRREVQLGAQLLVFQAATSTFQGSWAQPQHAALAAVRAVETGRPVVHAALSGTTAAFDATGHRLAWLDSSRVGSVVVDVPLATGRTPYDAAGDWVLVLAATVLGGALVVASLRPAELRD